MFSVLNQSQKSYRAMLADMKKQMRLMRKQMNTLQEEIDYLLKVMEGKQHRIAK